MKDKISLERCQRLHPSIQNEVIALIDKAEAEIDQNLAIRVVQGLRTFAEQDALYNQPWDKKDNDGDSRIDESDEKVTNAKAGSSYHNYGLALDFCFLWLNDNNEYVYDSQKSWLVGPNHAKVVKIFKNAGYKWGGDFQSIKDFPHLEKSPLPWQELLRRYKSKQFIKGTTYVKL